MQHTVIIYGLSHKYQTLPSSDQPEPQTRGTISDLEHIVAEYSPVAIAEEQVQGKQTIAEDIAVRKHITYCGIDIPVAVQDQIHCVKKGGCELDWPFEPQDMMKEYEAAWNLVREFHMYQEFQEKVLDKHPALSSSILVCGRAHSDRFKRLLRDRCEVIVYPEH